MSCNCNKSSEGARIRPEMFSVRPFIILVKFPGSVEGSRERLTFIKNFQPGNTLESKDLNTFTPVRKKRLTR